MNLCFNHFPGLTNNIRGCDVGDGALLVQVSNRPGLLPARHASTPPGVTTELTHPKHQQQPLSPNKADIAKSTRTAHRAITVNDHHHHQNKTHERVIAATMLSARRRDAVWSLGRRRRGGVSGAVRAGVGVLSDDGALHQVLFLFALGLATEL